MFVAFVEKRKRLVFAKSVKKGLEQSYIFGISDLDKTYFDNHIYLLSYEGMVRDKLLSYKFGDKSYIYKTFSRIVLNDKKVCNFLKGYDIITEVPIHRKRKSIRGYNQSTLIAREISKNIENIKYGSFLKKIKDNNRQSELSEEERKENVKNVYEVNDKDLIFNKKVVLFDDIYTTGNTVNECAKVLKEAGASEVLILTVAKTINKRKKRCDNGDGEACRNQE